MNIGKVRLPMLRAAFIFEPPLQISSRFVSKPTPV